MAKAKAKAKTKKRVKPKIKLSDKHPTGRAVNKRAKALKKIMKNS